MEIEKVGQGRRRASEGDRPELRRVHRKAARPAAANGNREEQHHRHGTPSDLCPFSAESEKTASEILDQLHVASQAGKDGSAAAKSL